MHHLHTQLRIVRGRSKGKLNLPPPPPSWTSDASSVVVEWCRAGRRCRCNTTHTLACGLRGRCVDVWLVRTLAESVGSVGVVGRTVH